MPKSKTEDDEWVTEPAVAKLFGVHPITIRRWAEDAELGFPAATDIRGRRYRSRKEISEWMRRRASTTVED
jgi:hypothetical protein